MVVLETAVVVLGLSAGVEFVAAADASGVAPVALAGSIAVLSASPSAAELLVDTPIPDSMAFMDRVAAEDSTCSTNTLR